MNKENIEISNVKQLQDIATNNKYKNDKGNIEGNFILVNDIDFSNIENPISIGCWDKKFIGTFNGNGFYIKNVLSEYKNKNFIGIFGCTKNARITNVKIKNGYVSTFTSGCCGGIIGQMHGGVLTGYSNVEVHAGTSAGGLVACMYDGIVIGSNTGIVCAGWSGNIGGLVGTMQNGVVVGFNSGDIEGSSNIGGLVGFMDGGFLRGYNDGSITAYTDFEHLAGYICEKSWKELSEIKGYKTPNAKLKKIAGDIKPGKYKVPLIDNKYEYLETEYTPFVDENSKETGWVLHKDKHPTLNLE